MAKNKPLNLSGMTVRDIASALLATKPMPRPAKPKKQRKK